MRALFGFFLAACLLNIPAGFFSDNHSGPMAILAALPIAVLFWSIAGAFKKITHVEIDESGVRLLPMGRDIPADEIDKIAVHEDIHGTKVLLLETQRPLKLYYLGAAWSTGRKSTIVLS